MFKNTFHVVNCNAIGWIQINNYYIKTISHNVIFKLLKNNSYGVKLELYIHIVSYSNFIVIIYKYFFLSYIILETFFNRISVKFLLYQKKNENLLKNVIKYMLVSYHVYYIILIVFIICTHG